jgi:hypothetical protein
LADAKCTLAGGDGVFATLFVSPEGSGPAFSAAQPGALIPARDHARTLLPSMNGNIVICLLAGVYSLTETFVLQAEDGGKNGFQMVYKAADGQAAVLSGGRTIVGWSLHDADKDVYKASVPAGWDFRQLYVDGVRAIRARHPNQTDATTKGPYFSQLTTDAPFSVNTAEIGMWANLNRVEMVWLGHWHQKRARIDRFDVNGGVSTVHFLSPESGSAVLNHSNQPNPSYFFENALELLDAEGEWYLDTVASTVYYKPRVGEDLSSSSVSAPGVETLVQILGGGQLRLSGLTFELTNWTKANSRGYLAWQAAVQLETDGGSPIPGAVQLVDADHVVVEDCTFRRTGAHGLVTLSSNHDHQIINNLFTDLSAGGVVLNGGIQLGAELDELVDGNLVERFGQEYTESVGILATHVSGTTISHNEIRDGRYTGISLGWSWTDSDLGLGDNDVGNNLIHHVMQLHDDGAGIYSLGRMDGTVIHNNYIHSLLPSPNQGGFPIAGIYPDNGSCFKTVKDNVLDNTNHAFYAYNQPNHDNVFQDNFFNCTFGNTGTNILQNNIEVNGSDWPAAAQSIIAGAGPF